MTLVSKKAPNFISPAVMENGEIINNFNFKNYINNHISVLFFWPMDFTFVCPTEIISFNKNYEKFLKRNVKIIGVSCDSVFVHKAWRSTDINDGGIGNIKYPMISDIKKEIIKFYNIEHYDLGVALRATFVIDKNNIIRFESVNDMQFGRNINEIIRIIDCIKYNDKYKNVCPVNWEKGEEGISPSIEGVKKYLKK